MWIPAYSSFALQFVYSVLTTRCKHEQEGPDIYLIVRGKAIRLPTGKRQKERERHPGKIYTDPRGMVLVASFAYLIRSPLFLSHLKSCLLCSSDLITTPALEPSAGFFISPFGTSYVTSYCRFSPQAASNHRIQWRTSNRGVHNG
jgi:hypothetical protein